MQQRITNKVNQNVTKLYNNYTQLDKHIQQHTQLYKLYKTFTKRNNILQSKNYKSQIKKQLSEIIFEVQDYPDKNLETLNFPSSFDLFLSFQCS